MSKLPMAWWSLFYISYFTLLGNGDARKGITQAMKGRPYYKEGTIINTFEFDGDVIDCIDIYKQPAFDHPLLQNHTIQMKPNFEPKSSTEYSKATALNDSTIEDTHPRLFRKGCPEGSIPIIRRTPYMNGIVRNDAMTNDSQIRRSRYLHKLGGIKETNSDQQHEYANLRITDENKLYGARAKFNVYRPRIELVDEMSIAQIWVASEDMTTVVEAGWTVNPTMYGDYNSRFFTFWTIDRYETGCYNLECPGFVWVNQDMALNAILEPSVYRRQQKYVTIEIFQILEAINALLEEGYQRPHSFSYEEHGQAHKQRPMYSAETNIGDSVSLVFSQEMESKDWWLKFDGRTVGYWPSSIVQKLDDGAHIHNFGGEVLNSGITGDHTTTQMGSGRFASEGEGRAASIKQVEIMHDYSRYTAPTDYEIDVTDPNCYNFELGLYVGEEWGFYFYYGGPGKSDICGYD